jgi:hypothetical protein
VLSSLLNDETVSSLSLWRRCIIASLKSLFQCNNFTMMETAAAPMMEHTYEQTGGMEEEELVSLVVNVDGLLTSKIVGM